MARKHDDLLADLDQLGTDDQPTTAPKPKSTTSKSKPASKPTPAADSTNDEDVLADLQAQLAAKPAASTSRPATPRLNSSKAPAEHTPASSAPGSARTSEDRLRAQPAASGARVSGEAKRSYHEGQAAEEVKAEGEAKVEGGGGGWWGSVFSAASAAVKQAETLAKEIQGNEEAQKWVGQVRGNIKGLQSFGDDLRSRAMPTFTTLIAHIAPPISAHERLQIHLTHDIHNYPSLDPLIYSTFSRIMSQVEGGDLVVLQRGSENRSRPRASSEQQGGYRGGILGSGSGWTDGPWWRDELAPGAKRDLSVVPGLREGTRLVRVSAEAYAKEFFAARGGVEAAAQTASEALSESNPVRSSDIFLALQAISHAAPEELFAADAAATANKEKGEADDEAPENLVSFAIYLHDPLHSLSFSTLSQPIPAQWASWLDAPNHAEEGAADALPASIQEIIAAGGVDPREWVSEWMEEVLGLGVGVVAQKYVAARMGVGATSAKGAVLDGKKRVQAEEEGVGGEAARAM